LFTGKKGSKHEVHQRESATPKSHKNGTRMPCSHFTLLYGSHGPFIDDLPIKINMVIYIYTYCIANHRVSDQKSIE
jgi:hypothetical protein